MFELFQVNEKVDISLKSFFLQISLSSNFSPLSETERRGRGEKESQIQVEPVHGMQTVLLILLPIKEEDSGKVGEKGR